MFHGFMKLLHLLQKKDVLSNKKTVNHVLSIEIMTCRFGEVSTRSQEYSGLIKTIRE